MTEVTETNPATKDNSISRGIVRESRDGVLVLAIPGTDYRLHLASRDLFEAGEKVWGRIRATARRIDRIKSGGTYVEPVEGRPRRVQGRIIAVDEVNAEIHVRAAGVFICGTTGAQRAEDYHPGEMVSFDIEPGATFERVT